MFKVQQKRPHHKAWTDCHGEYATREAADEQKELVKSVSRGVYLIDKSFRVIEVQS